MCRLNSLIGTGSSSSSKRPCSSSNRCGRCSRISITSRCRCGVALRLAAQHPSSPKWFLGLEDQVRLVRAVLHIQNLAIDLSHPVALHLGGIVRMAHRRHAWVAHTTVIRLQFLLRQAGILRYALVDNAGAERQASPFITCFVLSLGEDHICRFGSTLSAGRKAKEWKRAYKERICLSCASLWERL